MLLISCQQVFLFSYHGQYPRGRNGLSFPTLKQLQGFQVGYSMNILNNNCLLSRCCPRHLADSQGNQKRLSLSHRRGLKPSCCA